MADRGWDPLTTPAWLPRRRHARQRASPTPPRGEWRNWEGSMGPIHFAFLNLGIPVFRFCMSCQFVSFCLKRVSIVLNTYLSMAMRSRSLRT
jgi:hypothetical protein